MVFDRPCELLISLVQWSKAVPSLDPTSRDRSHQLIHPCFRIQTTMRAKPPLQPLNALLLLVQRGKKANTLSFVIRRRLARCIWDASSCLPVCRWSQLSFRLTDITNVYKFRHLFLVSFSYKHRLCSAQDLLEILTNFSRWRTAWRILTVHIGQ